MDTSIPRSLLLEWIQDCQGVLCLLTDKIDQKFLEQGKQIKVVSTMSVGMDHIQLDECQARHIQVFNTPDVLTDATADLAIGLLLCTLRKLPQAVNAVKEGTWGTWNPIWMCGSELKGKTVGIVGLGRIGQGIAERLLPFKVDEVLYTGTRDKKNQFEFVSLYCLFY